MNYDCNPPLVEGYNSKRDISPVVAYGDVYLPEAYSKNSIPADLEGIDENFNGIEKPESILGKPRDTFEAAQMRQTLSNYEPPKAE